MMLGNNKKKRKENPPKASEGKGKQKKKKREIRSPDFTRKAQFVQKNFSKKNLFQSFYSLVIDYHKAVIDYQKPKTVL